jgi:general stress protein 26
LTTAFFSRTVLSEQFRSNEQGEVMAEDQVRKIHELLSDFDAAMLVTHGGDFAHARPMGIAAVEPNCDVWFFTERGSPKVHEIQDDQSVLIVCQGQNGHYVTLSGRAELVADRTKARQLWSDSFKPWFPDGADDPNLLLICVHAQEAEYWDNSGMKALRYYFEAAKARARGTKQQVKEGEQHGHVRL